MPAATNNAQCWNWDVAPEADAPEADGKASFDAGTAFTKYVFTAPATRYVCWGFPDF